MDVAEQRLIDANALEIILKAQADIVSLCERPEIAGGFLQALDFVKMAPTVDAAPVVHAQNVTPTHYSDEFICGHCGFWGVVSELIPDGDDEPGSDSASVHEYECKFCPNCGAKMDATDNNVGHKDGGAEC